MRFKCDLFEEILFLLVTLAVPVAIWLPWVSPVTASEWVLFLLKVVLTSLFLIYACVIIISIVKTITHMKKKDEPKSELRVLIDKAEEDSEYDR